MFSKGSRYRNLPESSPVTARGERPRGKELRLISPLPGRFLHTVRDGDRLDLLAFKYYGDATRWWQIADANPEFAFPIDLVDRRPVVAERLVLAHAGFAQRLDALLTELSGFGQVRLGQLSFFTEVRPREPDFLDASVVVIYPPAATTHQQIVDTINQSFHFLDAFAWAHDGNTAEAFRFEDPLVKSQWSGLAASLAAAPGMVQVRSQIAAATLWVVYHGEVLRRETILALIAAHGFARDIDSATSLRTGARLVIPPNQVG